MDIDKLSGFFCPDDTFRVEVVNILCGDLFTNAAKNYLLKIYNEMDNEIDNNVYIIKPLSSNLNSKIHKDTLKGEMGNLYAGHDLPVWLNNPGEADNKRLMIISQDPRRNDNEMKGKEIGVSTPFGLHSRKWRSYKLRGLPISCAADLINLLNNNLSVYFTDIYKLRGVGGNSVIDTPNKSVYIEILKKEIDLFKPDVILTLGKEAEEVMADILNNSKIEPAPHPNARPNIWKAYEKGIKGYSACEKKKIIIQKLQGLLQSINHKIIRYK